MGLLDNNQMLRLLLFSAVRKMIPAVLVILCQYCSHNKALIRVIRQAFQFHNTVIRHKRLVIRMRSRIQKNAFISVRKGPDPAEQRAFIIAFYFLAVVRPFQIILNLAAQICKRRIKIFFRKTVPVYIYIPDNIPSGINVDIIQTLLQNIGHRFCQFKS